MKTIALFFFVVFSIVCNAQYITTCAGSGVVGYSGDMGSATIAKLSHPMGVIIDDSDNLLLCQRNLVRRVDFTTNIISTVAGDTSALSIGDGGMATNALVNNPYAVCIDTSGNLYIADYWTATIRKVNVFLGLISVYVGTTSVPGSTGDGGPATAAKIGGAGSICIDTSRNCLYLTDVWNNKVRKVDMATGIITTYAGTGTNGYSGDGGLATAAKFSRTAGLCLDNAGNVYIGDWDNARIRKVDVVTNIITSIAGNGTLGYSGDGGSATGAQINKTMGMCFDTCGNMYLTDENNNCVRRIDAATNIITTIAGNGTPGFFGDGGPATAALFNHPTGICIDKQGNLFVGDYYNHRIRKITPDTASCYHHNITLSVPEEKYNPITFNPNPSYGILNIENVNSISSYQIANAVGSVVLRGLLFEGSNTLSILHLPPGLYLLALIDEDGKRTVHKIVKE